MNNSNYSELYTWFENSGIISNLRTNLRKNLVNALKTNSSICEVKAEHRSAEQYVYDLLIAEYLLNYNYAYTLSVFTSEVPLLINLHRNVESQARDERVYRKNKLPNDYVFHTLQTLGINPRNSDGKNILSQYTTTEGPLILSIIRYLIFSISKLSEKNNNLEEIFAKNYQTKCDDTKSVDSRKSVLLSEAREKLYQQKKQFASQLKNKEFELRELAVSIERQLVLLNEKLQHAQNLMQLVDEKENHLIKERIKSEEILSNREIELSIKEKLLAQEAARLQQERDSYRTFEGDMKKLQEELDKVKNEIPHRSINVITVKRDACAQTEIFDNATTVEDLRLLNEEKYELSSLVKEQQLRIEELTMRAVTLSRKLEEAQFSKSPPDINPSRSVRNANVNTIFSESSSTEDILQDAKMRLRRLEEESLRADRYFHNCITSP